MINLDHKIAVVIPSYKVRGHIIALLNDIGPQISRIYLVDDCCPENSGSFAQTNYIDERLIVIRHEKNQGVGGAVMTGYQAAIADGMDIIVKLDGDGQMDPALIMDFVVPIIAGAADYTKGNRFFDLEEILMMPKVRLFGNAALSFFAKISSGYWNIFDPTNGYTAIHKDVVRHLPLQKISRRYFFETDMLFRLNTLRAVVLDIPMQAKYGGETSNLVIRRIFLEFLIKHLRNFFKRIFYNYYLRDMSLASIELPVGVFMLVFGVVYGGYHWSHSIRTGISSSPGTVMLSALPVIVGLQLVLAFLGHDIRSVPTITFHRLRRYAILTSEKN
jgi:dolichol-phosphate mannosyltransferase